ncbi:hypothetical protein NKDENANG_02373 [Candidatus Entotheonellaceae bacterium PAL068K]
MPFGPVTRVGCAAVQSKSSKELRRTWKGPLPGQALVVLEPQRMLISDVFLIQDGYAQKRSLIAQVLQPVEAEQLWTLG